MGSDAVRSADGSQPLLCVSASLFWLSEGAPMLWSSRPARLQVVNNAALSVYIAVWTWNVCTSLGNEPSCKIVKFYSCKNSCKIVKCWLALATMFNLLRNRCSFKWLLGF